MFEKLPNFVKLILVIVPLVISFIVILILCLWMSSLKTPIATICLEPVCINLASNVLSKLDNTIHPCDNFYKYSCNGWIKMSQIPDGFSSWSIFHELSMDVDYFIKDLLSEDFNFKNEKFLNLAQIYYQSCMNEDMIDKHEFIPLYEKLLQLFGGWIILPPKYFKFSNETNDLCHISTNKFKLNDVILPLLEHWGTTSLFTMYINSNIRNSSEFLIHIDEGVLNLPKENYILNYTTYYREFMRKYSLMLGVPDSELIHLDYVYEFERQIAMQTADSNKWDPEDDYKIVNLENLTQICPVVDWIKLLDYFFNPLNYTISNDQLIAIEYSPLFRQRCELYSNYTKTKEGIKVLHNSAVWNFLWRTTSFMPANIRQLYGDYKRIISGVQTIKPRWQTCIWKTDLFYDAIIGLKFVEMKFLHTNTKSIVTTMINQTKEIMKEMINTTDWMNNEDKQKAMDKVNLMNESVGYPDPNDAIKQLDKMFVYKVNLNETFYFENSLLLLKASYHEHLNSLVIKSENLWIFPAHTINAAYGFLVNRMFIPAGILQAPFFHNSFPLAINFGGIGMVIGHEITHGFDDSGSQFDQHGNFRTWWSNETRKSFENKIQCIKNQYSQYSINNQSIDENLTIGENIADNGGLRAAYKAYKIMASKYPDRFKLPGLNYTADQLFFLGFAQTWCDKRLPQSMLNQLKYDPHSPAPYRVIGTLSNMPEFSTAFNCASGTVMNPIEKCVVW